MSAGWTRETPWRQGHVLPLEASVTLGLSHPETPEATCVVVVSHDCDLANDNLHTEPDVEVIVGRHLKEANGNYLWAKAPRTLHINALHNGNVAVIELTATAKRAIPKDGLAAFTPDSAYCLSGKSLAILRSWLSIRYNRAAFPDLFVQRLSDADVNKRLASRMESHGQHVSAVYFDVDGGRELDRTDGSAYELQIVLAYQPGDDPEETAKRVDSLGQWIEQLFASKYFDSSSDTWDGIALKSCMAISEDDLTVSKAKLLKQWLLEYLTLKADDEQPSAHV